MKLISTYAGESSEINLIRSGDFLKARIDGREYDLEISEPESDIYLLKHNGNIYEVFVSPNENDGSSVVAKS